MALGSTQPLVKMSTRNMPGGKGGRCVRLTTYHHTVPLSRNLGALTLLDHSVWPVTGVLYMGIAQTLSADSYHSHTGTYSSIIRSWCNRTNYDCNTYGLSHAPHIDLGLQQLSNHHPYIIRILYSIVQSAAIQLPFLLMILRMKDRVQIIYLQWRRIRRIL